MSLIDVLIHAGLLGLGVVLVWAIAPSEPTTDRLVLGYPLGLGALTWLVFLISWAGVPLSASVVVACYLATAAACSGTIWLRRGARRTPLSAQSGPVGRRWLTEFPFTIAWLSILLLVMAAALTSVARSYSTWDAMAIWAVKGLGISNEATVLAAGHWGSHGLSYPLNIPIAIAIFGILGGSPLSGSKLIFPILYACLLLMCYSFWVDWKVKRSTAAIATLLVGSTPIIYQHATIGYANLPLATYLVSGILLTADGLLRSKSGRALLGGALLGLGAWTRPEGAAVVALSLLLLFAARLIARKSIGSLVATGAVAAAVSLPWLVFSRLYAPAPEAFAVLREASQRTLLGEFHLGAAWQVARYVIRQAANPQVWGIALILPPLLIAIALIKRGRSQLDRLPWQVGLVSAGILATTIGFYYATSFGPMPVQWWLDTSLNRMMMPGVLLLVVFSFLIWRPSHDGENQPI